MYGHDMDGWMFLWMALAGAFWIGITVLVVFSLSEGFGRRGNQDDSAPHSATDILKRRYASGELSEEEFRRMSEHIR